MFADYRQAILDLGGARMAASSKYSHLHCSFCLLSADDVKKLIAGANGYICDSCVSLCNSILEDSGEQRPFSTGAV